MQGETVTSPETVVNTLEGKKEIENGITYVRTKMD